MKASTVAERITAWVKANHGYLLNVGVLAVLYLAAAKLGLSVAATTRQITPVWPPTGIALAALLVMGRRYWPGIALGAFLANALTNEPPLVALGVAAGNTLEALVAAELLVRVAKFKDVLDTPRQAGALVVAVAAGAVMAASIGSLSLALGGLIVWGHYWSNWFVWWAGDFLGGVLVGSFVLAALDRRGYTLVRQRLIEGGILLAGLFATSMLVFTASGGYSLLHYYLLFPFLIWAALRFTQLGVATASLIVAAVVVWADVNGLGPLAGMPVDQSLIQLLVVVTVVDGASFILAMAIRQRETVVAALRQQTGRLEQLDSQLREANRRMTDILASVLDDSSNRHERQDWRNSAPRPKSAADEPISDRNSP